MLVWLDVNAVCTFWKELKLCEFHWFNFHHPRQSGSELWTSTPPCAGRSCRRCRYRRLIGIMGYVFFIRPMSEKKRMKKGCWHRLFLQDLAKSCNIHIVGGSIAVVMKGTFTIRRTLSVETAALFLLTTSVICLLRARKISLYGR